MSFAQASRDADGSWRARCLGWPPGNCIVTISAHKPSGLCYFCERSKALGQPQIRITCEYKMGGRKYCGLPILHLGSHKPAPPLTQRERDANRVRRQMSLRKRTI